MDQIILKGRNTRLGFSKKEVFLIEPTIKMR